MRIVMTYVTFIGVFLIGTVLLLQVGNSLDPAVGAKPPAIVHKVAAEAPLRTLLVQVAVILAAAWLFGSVAHRIGQPRVVGEIAAGLILGPTVFGHFAPALFRSIFPPASLGTLELLASIGVVLFMFCVGLDLDPAALQSAHRTVVVVSHASIALPYFLGVAASLALFRSFAPSGTPFIAFALFIGISMSITAFPVLSRILTERGMAGTRLGSMALACAAVDDITAWSLLAVVVAVARAQRFTLAIVAVAGIVLFTILMVRFVRPLLARYHAGESQSLILLFLSAAATETIGVHSVFGAFLAGAILPKEGAAREVTRQRLSLLGGALLPLFFAFTGLRTELTLLTDIRSWLICAGIVLIATIGKAGGSALAARLTGYSWPDAMAVGALMNTRGLMELIALNIGYELGILTPALFAMMVLMALVTTIATTPLLELSHRVRAIESRPMDSLAVE